MAQIKMKPAGVIKARLGIQKGGPVHKFFTNTCYKHMDKYVPYREGNLRSIVDVATDTITYESPYARYMYYGKKMVMDNGKSAYYSPDYGFWSEPGGQKHLTDEDLVYHTPGTGPYWDKKMVSAEMSEVVKEVQDYVKTHGGK